MYFFRSLAHVTRIDSIRAFLQGCNICLQMQGLIRMKLSTYLLNTQDHQRAEGACWRLYLSVYPSIRGSTDGKYRLLLLSSLVETTQYVPLASVAMMQY